MKTQKEAWEEWLKKESLSWRWTHGVSMVERAFLDGWTAAMKEKSPSEEKVLDESAEK